MIPQHGDLEGLYTPVKAVKMRQKNGDAVRRQ